MAGKKRAMNMLDFSTITITEEFLAATQECAANTVKQAVAERLPIGSVFNDGDSFTISYRFHIEKNPKRRQ